MSDFYEDRLSPWRIGALWLCDMSLEELDFIIKNFPKYYDQVEQVENQIFAMQIGLF